MILFFCLQFTEKVVGSNKDFPAPNENEFHETTINNTMKGKRNVPMLS